MDPTDPQGSRITASAQSRRYCADMSLARLGRVGACVAGSLVLLSAGLVSVAGSSTASAATYDPTAALVVASDPGIQHLAAVPISDGAVAFWEVDDVDHGQIYGAVLHGDVWSTPELLSDNAKLGAEPVAAVFDKATDEVVVSYVMQGEYSANEIQSVVFDGTSFGVPTSFWAYGYSEGVALTSNGEGSGFVSSWAPYAGQIVVRTWSFDGVTASDEHQINLYELLGKPVMAQCPSGQLNVGVIETSMGIPTGSPTLYTRETSGAWLTYARAMGNEATSSMDVSCSADNLVAVAMARDSRVALRTHTGSSDWQEATFTGTAPTRVKVQSGPVVTVAAIDDAGGRPEVFSATGTFAQGSTTALERIGSGETTDVALWGDAAGYADATWVVAGGEPVVDPSVETSGNWLAVNDSALAVGLPVIAWEMGQGHVIGVYDTGSTHEVRSTTIVPELPQTPTIEAVDIHQTSAVLSLMEPHGEYDGSGYTRYAVRYSTQGGTHWRTLTCAAGSGGSQSGVCAPRPSTRGCALHPNDRRSPRCGETYFTLQLNNLLPGKRYYFKVAVVSPYGRSAYSAPVGPYATWSQPAGVRDLTARRAGQQAIALTWHRPADTGGVGIDYYQVSIRKATRNGAYTFAARQVFDRRFVVAGLNPHSNYWVRVRAVNSRGLVGPWLRAMPKVHL